VILDAQNEIMSFWGMNENFESTSSTTDNNMIMMIQQKKATFITIVMIAKGVHNILINQ